MNYHDIANSLTQLLGGKENLNAIESCMTRVRVLVKDIAKCDAKAIEKIEGVLGVAAEGDYVQVIVGPGKSKKISE